MERFEHREHGSAVVTAGWSEARSTGAIWIPNTVPAVPAASITDQRDAPFDLLFFGKLSVLPNVDAMRTLAEIWPRLTEEIPNLSCLLAGADLTQEIRESASTHGWVAEEDFAGFAALCRRARIAVAPLRHANGIQNKVLEAAAADSPKSSRPRPWGAPRRASRPWWSVPARGWSLPFACCWPNRGGAWPWRPRLTPTSWPTTARSAGPRWCVPS